jgi:hypothetical protein
MFSMSRGALRALKRVFPLPAGTCRRADQPSPDPAAMLVEFILATELLRHIWTMKPSTQFPEPINR